MAKNIVWSACIAILVLVGYETLPRGPVSKDTPFMRELARIHEIGSKLTQYSYDHNSLPGGEAAGKSIDGLVAAGILSADDANYIRDHQIQFYGFDPAQSNANAIVFEAICSNTTPRRRITNYRDGHTGYTELAR